MCSVHMLVNLNFRKEYTMKKLLSLAASALMVSALALNAAAANVSDFSDMPDDWSTPALTAAVENGLLNGSDGKILPANNLTRAQMAAIISRAFGAESRVALNSFTDVPSDAWYYGDMQKAVAMGVFNGDGSGLLNPENNITREQVFAVLARAFKLPDGDVSVLDKFSDKNDVSDWAKPYAAALVGNGYISGSGGLINAKANITRAEFAQVMFNMVKTYVDTPGTLSVTYEGNVIIRSSGVTVSKDAKINGILVVSEKSSSVTVEQGAAITKLIDNSLEGTKTEDAPAQDKGGSNITNVELWQIIDGTTPTNPTTPPDNNDSNLDGWTEGIYRP